MRRCPKALDFDLSHAREDFAPNAHRDEDLHETRRSLRNKIASTLVYPIDEAGIALLPH